MSASPPRVGVIGAGGHWGPNLARNFAALGALGALCESDAGRLEAIGARFPEARRFNSVDALLESEGLDAVAIAAPAVTHGALAAQALDKGLHVFVEKPLCLDIAEGQRLSMQADKAGRVLMVGHLLRYHPAFEALSAAVASGRLGRLRYIYSHRLSLGKIRREENALWSFAPHDISMILALTGALPTRVVANGGHYLDQAVADTTLSHLTFADSVQAHLFVSWLHPYKDQRLVVVGSDGMVVFNDVAEEDDKLLFYRHQVGWEGNVPRVTKAEAEPLVYARREPLADECAHFLRCVRSGARPRTDATEALGVLRVLDACQRSLVGGMPVVLSEG